MAITNKAKLLLALATALVVLVLSLIRLPTAGASIQKA